jgi:phospholipase C
VVKRLPALLLLLCLATVAGVLLSLNGCGGVSSSTNHHPPPPGKIQHIVLIIQENRTPDNLFQDPVLIGRGADIAQNGLSTSGTVPLTSIDLGTAGSEPDIYDLNHAHDAFTEMYDGGKMDGANMVKVECPTSSPNCAPANAQYKYVLPSDVAPYFSMAEQYTFADRMFQTNEGPSFPAHQFLLAGTSAPSAGSNMFASENPKPNDPTGCIAPPTATIYLIDPTGTESTQIYPCFEHPTLTDSLDAANLTWRYYSPLVGYIWTAPTAIQHMCQPNNPPPNGTACVGPDYTGSNPKVSISSTQVLTDISSGNLASVVWVIPTGQASDHASINDGSGPSWVSSVVNAIGSSPYWSNTAILVMWDDWGGWYDHVPPPAVLQNCAQWGCGYVYGFRVPLIVISPYAKAQYISHVNHDFGSVLKFVEETFSLPALGYADSAALDDLSDCFDFTQTPLPFTMIAAPLNAEHFINDHRPPLDPDDDD